MTGGQENKQNVPSMPFLTLGSNCKSPGPTHVDFWLWATTFTSTEYLANEREGKRAQRSMRRTELSLLCSGNCQASRILRSLTGMCRSCRDGTDSQVDISRSRILDWKKSTYHGLWLLCIACNNKGMHSDTRLPLTQGMAQKRPGRG